MTALQRQMGASDQQSLPNTSVEWHWRHCFDNTRCPTLCWALSQNVIALTKPSDLDGLDICIMGGHQEPGKQTSFITAGSARTTHTCQLMSATPIDRCQLWAHARLVVPQVSTSVTLQHGGAVPPGYRRLLPPPQQAHQRLHMPIRLDPLSNRFRDSRNSCNEVTFVASRY